MLLRDLITDAYYESAVVALGVDVQPNELAIGLRKLNSYLHSLFGNEISTNMDTIFIPQEAEKVVLNVINRSIVSPTKDVVEISLPIIEIYDGAITEVVLLGNKNYTVKFTGAIYEVDVSDSYSITASQSPETFKFFFRADKATWYRVKEWGLEDNSPLPSEFDDYLICWLAARLSAINGADPRQGTTMALSAGANKLAARYGSRRNVIYPEVLRPSIQAYNHTVVGDFNASDFPI